LKLKEDAIFWVTVRNEKKLATLSNMSTNRDYKENLVQTNGKRYSIWNPYTSKLAAAIINGMEIFPILKKTKILYLDPTTEKTVKHISNIVGINGKIFVVRDVMKNSKNFLGQIMKNRPNIFLIVPDKTNPTKFSSMTEMVDVVYIDIAKHNEIEITIQNCKNYLRNGGYLMLVVPTKNIDFVNNPSKKNQEERKELQSSFDIIQEINLTGFFEEYSMVIAKYLG